MTISTRVLYAVLLLVILGLGSAASAQTGGTDYSSDGTLIDVRTAEQLNAMRWDLDGDGVPFQASRASYSAAFPDALPRMGCASTCTGYVLRNDIDLGVSRWGRSSSARGWTPIGGGGAPYVARFDGDGRIISNLYINRSGRSNTGLFGRIGVRGRIEGLGLVDAVVVANQFLIGALVGDNAGEIANSYAIADVSGGGGLFVGGLVGHNGGVVRASYAIATVGGQINTGGLAGLNSGNIEASYAVATVSGQINTGGLVGWNDGGTVRASYAVAAVSGQDSIGGLVGINAVGGLAGSNFGNIEASYAVATVGGNSAVGGLAGSNFGNIEASYVVATVSGNSVVGGLAGSNSGNIEASYAVATVGGNSAVGGLAGENSGNIEASYWDTDVSGLSASAGGTSKTTSELQTPTTAAGIYSTWDDVDVDGDTEADDPWDFGTHRHYPVLQYGGLSTATQFAAQPGNNASLQSLVLSRGVLAPAFDGEITSYTAIVGNEVSVLTVTATAVQGSASVVYSPADEDRTAGGHQVGPTDTVAITVTSLNQADERTYTVALTQAPFSDLDLTSLVLSAGALAPNFTGAITDYRAEVSASSLTVTAGFSQAASATVNGNELTSGQPSDGVALALGANTLAIKVGAGGTTKTYTVSVTRAIDYDDDGDGLISVTTLEQLNAIRWDLDGDGRPFASGYVAAFPYAATGMGCPSSGCTGYELDADLDFDTNDDGVVNADDGALSWGAGADASGGWLPVNNFAATFMGNGRVISNLFISRGESSGVGLFGRINAGGKVEGLGLADAVVVGSFFVGGLAGENAGEIIGSYAIATVSGDNLVGGLVGLNNAGAVGASYAIATVSGDIVVGGLVGRNSGNIEASYAVATVGGDIVVGGLVGRNSGNIEASYAVATVGGGSFVGGLVGGQNNGGTVTASYVVATVSGNSVVGGLAGSNSGNIEASYAVATVGGNSAVGGLAGENSGNIEASYWDTDVSGLSASAGGTSKTTSELQTPTTAAGIYSTWDDVDVDGDTEADDPWDFGTHRHYPVLQYGGLSTATQFAAQPGNNASLQSLVLSRGVLAPAFDGEITSYTAIVGNEVSVLTVTATAVQGSASVVYSPADEDRTAGGHQVGPTDTVAITVTSLNQTDERTYTVALTQAPFSDLDLTSLVLSAGALAPNFTGAITDYRAEVSASSLTVTAGFSQAASATVNGNELTSGQPSDGVALALGVNTLAIKVGAGGTTKTYTVSVTRTIGYDDDGDGLISVTTLEQLNAIRWDLDGDGRSFSSGYVAAFPYAAMGMGCPSSGCTGYELDADLDFDTNDDGVVNADDGALSWGAGGGWLPVNNFAATFMGNGRVISNLFISRSGSSGVGLFGRINAGGKVEGLGLADAVVAGNNFVGGLAGENAGEIIGSYAIATVGGAARVGGLVGWNRSGGIGASYALATVNAGDANVGGLVGLNSNGRIRASYAVATVGGGRFVGGLVGGHDNGGTVTASYVVATVSGSNSVGGLAGGANTGMIADSYYDTDVSGLRSGAEGTTKTTVELQTPTNYAGIYSGWNVDVDGDTVADDPWDFGTDGQYPVLQYGDLSTATQFAAQLANDASLRSLTLSQGVLAPPFDGAITSYTVLVSERVPVLTVAAIAAQSAASVAYFPADADETTGGYQLRTTDAVVITVTAPNELAQRTYALSVTRGGLATVNVTVRPKVFLQGAYDRAGGRMKTTYKNLLPALSPYGAVRDVDLSGLLDGVRFGLSAVTDTVVDWVLVELRATTRGIAAATSSTVRDRQAALLLSDGRVVGVNPGAASPPAAIALGHVALSISEDDLIDGNDLYVLIRHRNHLPVMTTATGGGGCETDYCADFTRRQSWQDGQHDMGGGFYAMFAGDADRDGDIDFDDEAAIRRHNLTAVTGGGQYISGVVNGDLDFDGDVLSSDRLFILINGARRACAVCYP